MWYSCYLLHRRRAICAIHFAWQDLASNRIFTLTLHVIHLSEYFTHPQCKHNASPNFFAISKGLQSLTILKGNSMRGLERQLLSSCGFGEKALLTGHFSSEVSNNSSFCSSDHFLSLCMLLLKVFMADFVSRNTDYIDLALKLWQKNLFPTFPRRWFSWSCCHFLSANVSVCAVDAEDSMGSRCKQVLGSRPLASRRNALHHLTI